MAAVAETASSGTGEPKHLLKRPYLLVFVVLALVTLFEVNIGAVAGYLDSAFGIVVTSYEQYALLLGTAAAKAGLVGLYYMHLRYEPLILRLVPLAPLAFVVALVVVVMLH